VLIPEDPAAAAMDQRIGNEQIARTDRQAVFRGRCASCHVPAKTRLVGADLFRAACAICHESPHRAGMVPDLAERGSGKKADYWTRWIESGREGSLMPAFAVEKHGILTSAETATLAQYLTRRYGSIPSRP
jgi:mono/diheme cytochrome c family protein